MRGPPARNTPMPRARTPGVRCRSTDIPSLHTRCPEDRHVRTARRLAGVARHAPRRDHDPRAALARCRPLDAGPPALASACSRHATKGVFVIASSPQHARAPLRRPVRRPSRRLRHRPDGRDARRAAADAAVVGDPRVRPPRRPPADHVRRGVAPDHRHPRRRPGGARRHHAGVMATPGVRPRRRPQPPRSPLGRQPIAPRTEGHRGRPRRHGRAPGPSRTPWLRPLPTDAHRPRRRAERVAP